jgi:hypothetical protein
MRATSACSPAILQTIKRSTSVTVRIHAVANTPMPAGKAIELVVHAFRHRSPYGVGVLEMRVGEAFTQGIRAETRLDVTLHADNLEPVMMTGYMSDDHHTLVATFI